MNMIGFLKVFGGLSIGYILGWVIGSSKELIFGLAGAMLVGGCVSLALYIISQIKEK